MPRVQRIGIYKAEVMDISNFKDTGKIQVRALGINVEDTWVDAEVLTPFGGLPNVGMQALPPIGSIGCIIYERGQNTDPIWVGSLMRSWGEEFEEGYGNNVEAEDPTDFIIKTQHTKLDNREIDTNSNKIENIIKMNEKALLLAKVNQEDNNYEYKKEAYDLDPESNPDLPYQIIALKDSGIIIKYKPTDSPEGEFMTFYMTPDNIKMTHVNNTGEKTISVNSDDIKVKTGSTIITVEYDGKVKIEGEQINLAGDSKTAALYEGFRDFVNQAFNSHIHGTPAGPSSPPTAKYTGTNSAKSEKVKLK